MAINHCASRFTLVSTKHVDTDSMVYRSNLINTLLLLSEAKPLSFQYHYPWLSSWRVPEIELLKPSAIVLPPPQEMLSTPELDPCALSGSVFKNSRWRKQAQKSQVWKRKREPGWQADGLHASLSIHMHTIYTLSPVLSRGKAEFGLMSPSQTGKRRRRKRSECSITWMPDWVKVHYPVSVITLALRGCGCTVGGQGSGKMPAFMQTFICDPKKLWWEWWIDKEPLSAHPLVFNSGVWAEHPMC